MKKVLTLLSLAIVGVACFMVFNGSSARAESFNKNNVMDDAVFDDWQTMSTGQIQSFLNGFPNSCLKNYKAPYPNSYSSYGNKVSAATVIKRSANFWKMNPRVILATLEKEEGLVSGNSGCAGWRYNSAMGMGCPDGGSCPAPGYAGFSKQVVKGSWQLKFSKERAYGNIAWDGDNNVYYYGFMTRGNRSRQAGQTSRYYDGYATIDGQSVHMTNGATAALYTYTPHFHGNQTFVSIFSKWFGSTQFNQPAGGALYRQSSNGKIYLATSDSSGNLTRFYIPSNSIMDNYGLKSYKTISASDGTINAMANGGVLTNYVRDSSGGVYLVNKKIVYHIPGSSMCTAWNIDCFNSNVVHTLGNTFETRFLKSGGTLNTVASYKGVYYKMTNGVKQPFANVQSLKGSGFSTSSVVPLHPSNAQQPLGKLIVKTLGIIRFSPKATIYYFDGSSYWSVNNMGVYNDWALNKANNINTPTSTFNSSDNPTTVGSLSHWQKATSGQDYVINSGVKLKLNSNQSSLWPSGNFTAGPDNLLNNLPTRNLNKFIKSDINYYELTSSGTKNYIASTSDFADLGLTSKNLTHLSPTLASAIKSGPIALPNGRLIKIDNGATIYATYNNQLYKVADMNTLRAYGFSHKIRTYTSSLFANSYPTIGTLSAGKGSNGSVYYPYRNKLLTIKHPSGFGVIMSNFQDIDRTFLKSTGTKNVTNFLRNSDNGRIYYASGGALHYVTSQASFVRYGGNKTPLTAVDTRFISLFHLGANI